MSAALVMDPAETPPGVSDAELLQAIATGTSVGRRTRSA